jgi:hypothetical protein
MKYHRIGSFGAYALLVAATPALAAPTSEQAAKGPYRGAYVCQTKTGVPGIFRIPIDLVIRNGNVEFSRPLLNRNATRIIGNEMASGTIDADGKMHLTSTWYNGGVIFHADYSGTLTPSGGTFMGTQTWRGPRGLNGSRTCTAAFVQLAGAGPSPSQQSPLDQSPPDQSRSYQSPPDQSRSYQSPSDQVPSDQSPSDE